VVYFNDEFKTPHSQREITNYTNPHNAMTLHNDITHIASLAWSTGMTT